MVKGLTQILQLLIPGLMERIGNVKIAMPLEPKVLQFPNTWKDLTATSYHKVAEK
jgi:hypothetical protein